MEAINNAIEAMRAKRRNLQILFIGYAVVFVAALLLLAYGRSYIGIAICVVNLAVYFVLLRPRLLGYQDMVNDATVRFGVAEPLEQPENDSAKGGLTREEFTALELLPLMPTENALLCRNNFSGEKDGMTLRGSELTFQATGTAAQGKERYRFLTGTILTADYHAPTKEGDWLVLGPGLMSREVKEQFLQENGYRPVQAGETLEKKFSIYTRTDAEEMPDWLERRVVTLTETHKKVYALRLKQGAAAVYLWDRFYTFNLKLRDLPTPEGLSHNYLPERDDCWALFRYWGEA